MVKWAYDKDVQDAKFKAIPVGQYRCRIEEAIEETSQKGNEMIKLVLAISGYNSKVYHYIVFMPEGNDKNGNPLMNITNRNLKSLYEGFGIPEGDLNANGWVGKVGGVKLKHEEFDGSMQAKVSYFLNQAQQVALPAWTVLAEGEKPAGWA